MNAYFFQEEKLNHRWFAPVIQFLVERLVLGSVAAPIVYGGYRMFML